MRIIALLPMKGNSERVPNKNLREFNGKPLYHRVMNSLLKSKYIDTVIIDTDSQSIKKDVQENYGKSAIVIDRPEYIIGDMISMNKIIEYDIDIVDADLYIQTHSTNPLLKSHTIDLALEKMIELSELKSYDSIFSVTRLQTRLYNSTAEPFNHNPKELIRTQDLEPLFEENSNFYIFTKQSFTEAGNKRIGLKPFMFEMEKLEAVDIDEPQDFLIAESLHKIFNDNR